MPAEQSIDVRFHDFMADEEKTVARVYERAGQPMTEAAGEAMAEFVTSHPRGRHGGVRYQPEAVGMDVAERRAALKFYVDRFGVEEEKTVARVYERAGQPMTEAAGEAMAEFVRSHPRGRNGGVRYQPDAVGIDVADRRAGLQFYVDRFGVEQEIIGG